LVKGVAQTGEGNGLTRRTTSEPKSAAFSICSKNTGKLRENEGRGREQREDSS